MNNIIESFRNTFREIIHNRQSIESSMSDLYSIPQIAVL